MVEPALSLVVTAPAIADQVLHVPVVDIDMGDRLRPIDLVWVEALAAVMGRDGQDAPIEVCRLPGRPGYLLVTGGHRLTAANRLGWDTVKAIVVTAEKAARRRKEISENIFRRGLDPIDRAAFVAELYALERAAAGLAPDADPRTAGANARWAKVIKAQADDATAAIAVGYGFTDAVAAAVGLSVRSIRTDLELHRGLPPHITTRLRGLPIAGNAGQLRALAKLAEADQLGVIGLLVEGKAKGVADALGILKQKPPADMQKKAWSAFFGGWGRMNARRKREALQELVASGLPAGVSIIFGEAADA